MIEIFSPTSLKRDTIDKLKTYAEYNIPEYWMVDPLSRTLEQYVLATILYGIINIFQRDEIISSLNISCVSFTMQEVMENLPTFKE